MTTRIAPGVGANLLGQHSAERNQDATVYVGNLDAKVSEELLWELFVQAGPVVNVYVPKDRVTNAHQGYGFVEFRSEEDADYAIKVLNMIKLYGKAIRVNKASQDKKSVDVGANLFIGNLDPDVDEKLLYDTFSAFGVIVTNPKIMRDPETGNSRGFGFISYDSFEASDAAIETMNGQYLCNRQITVSYAYKKDTKGERHGTPAGEVSLLISLSAAQTHCSFGFKEIERLFKFLHQLVSNGLILYSKRYSQCSSTTEALCKWLRSSSAYSSTSATSSPASQPMYPPAQMPAQSWQGQPPQPGSTGIPPPMQQFRGMPPPPPPQVSPALVRPPPPPAGLVAPPVWRPPPPPQQLTGGPHSMPPHMSMAPPQQLSMPPPPPPQ
ncbi:UNVERIFIED_CONTAM: Splicing factor 3B subunit [Sesamum radiatum]|uniref:Splicing factor 3B subunit 4 n=1 Tax=Sesamum radiatum TaxID=300843 RepID=A0AAW2P5B0_SESRA